MKKQKTILVVSPKGVPVKALKIKAWVIILVVLFFVLGFIGYFIPYEKFTLNKVELNQKKNLTEQNKALFQSVVSTLKLLNNLKDHMLKLENKRNTVLQFGIIGSDTTSKLKRVAYFGDMPTRELLLYISSREEKIREVTSYFNQKNNPFEKVPVIRPVLKSSSVSRQYGNALDPFTGKYKFHGGVDFIGEKGAPVVAVASGVVTRTENHPMWGKRIFIDHGNGFKTIYAHLGELKVSGNQKVDKGELVGYIGLTGLTSGPHVHYEMEVNNSKVNPAEYYFPIGLF